MTDQDDNVRLQIIQTDPDGATRFVDAYLPYTLREGPLRTTDPIAATAIQFRWTPGTFESDVPPAPRRHLVMVTEGAMEITAGSGESRVFRPGDILSIHDTWGQGHRSRAFNGQPFRSTVIALDADRRADRREVTSSDGNDGIDYVHNQETAQGVSFYENKSMPYVYAGPEGKETEALMLQSIQFVMAASNLAYDWHPAPQRQVVLVLTGGLAMAYGDGSHCEVSPGGFLIGEDTDGRGHITRALNGQPRFSVFAHLV